MKKLTKILLTIFILIFSIKVSFALENTEKVTDYVTNIIVNKDGSLNVTQKIKVNVLGQQFVHGAYFDLIQKKVSGNLRSPVYKILKTEMNNSPVPWDNETVNEMRRIKIGDKNKILDPGIYTFTLEYNVLYEIAFYEDHDELFFNVNSPFEVPIDKLSGTISFAEGIDTTNLKFIGFQGSVLSTANFDNFNFTNKVLNFKYDSNLNPREIVSLGVWFPKGTFNRAEITDVSIHMDKYLLYSIPFGIFLISLLINLFFFKSKNLSSLVKNPPVTFDLPKNLAPSEVRYLDKQIGDNKSTSVEIINLAIKKIIKIEKDDGWFFQKGVKITLLDKNKAETKLEKKILDLLFSKKEVLATRNYADSRTVYDTGIEILKQNKKKGYFKYNQVIIKSVIFFLQYLFIGLFITIFLSDSYKNIDSIGALLLIISFYAVIIHLTVYGIINKKFKYCIVFILLSIFLLFFTDLFIPLDLIFLLLASTFPYFYFHFKNYYDIFDNDSIELLAKIRGFKIFAQSQEEYLSGVHTEMPLTLEMYEKYLPYAIALDVETAWSKKFNNVFKNLTEEQRAELSAFNTANIVYINSSLNSTISYYGGTSTSAFSGGGYAGGGGGGGGGGGW